MEDEFIRKIENNEDDDQNNRFNNNESDNDMDNEILRNVNSYLIYGSVIKWLVILASVITSLILVAEDEEFIVLALVISIVGIIVGIIIAMMIKWFGYTLLCLYDIRKNTRKN